MVLVQYSIFIENGYIHVYLNLEQQDTTCLLKYKVVNMGFLWSKQFLTISNNKTFHCLIQLWKSRTACLTWYGFMFTAFVRQNKRCIPSCFSSSIISHVTRNLSGAGLIALYSCYAYSIILCCSENRYYHQVVDLHSSLDAPSTTSIINSG